MKFTLPGLLLLVCMVLPITLYAQTPNVVIIPQDQKIKKHHDVNLFISGGPIAWVKYENGGHAGIFANYDRFTADFELTAYEHNARAHTKEGIAYQRIALGVRVRKLYVKATYIDLNLIEIPGYAQTNRVKGLGLGGEIHPVPKRKDLTSKLELSGFPYLSTTYGPSMGMFLKNNQKLKFSSRVAMEFGVDALMVVPYHSPDRRSMIGAINGRLGMAFRIF